MPQLEIGKTYQTRSGRTVEITGEVKSDFTLVGSFIGQVDFGGKKADLNFYPNGRFLSEEGKVDSVLDLI